MTSDRPRCAWCTSDPLYQRYHDEEWGVPVHDDRRHFEFLILEGAQAGLSWLTILKKREAYRRAFLDFDPEAVARMSDQDLEARLQDPGIVRNRLKVLAARTNAQAFLRIQQAFGSFDAYVWPFVGGAPKINHWASLKEIPAVTPEAEALSRDLRKRGMTFVGPTILYAHMQATGLVDDHTLDCWRRSAQA